MCIQCGGSDGKHSVRGTELRRKRPLAAGVVHGEGWPGEWGEGLTKDL